jgi:hypothetical protein
VCTVLETPGEVDSTGDWKNGLIVLCDEVNEGDPVVLMSSRGNNRGWHSELETLPKSLSTLTDGDFITVYPAQEERADDRRVLQFQ